MPQPLGRRQRYMPGLDGLRAIAVAAVVAYHLGDSWAPGGLLGVGVFFTLSGYLITDLLLAHWEDYGNLGLGEFWLRRARRLLPALAVMLGTVAVWVAVADPSELSMVRGDLVAAAFYVSNWWLIFHHVSYFARFGPPSPLGHLWSLAVEEQFYLVWPAFLALGLWFSGRRRDFFSRRRPKSIAVMAIVISGASALEMALLYQPSLDPSRVYDGTDTRAFGLLIGAALAVVWPSRRLHEGLGIGARLAVEIAGLLGLATIATMVALTNQYSAFIYRGGLALLSLGTALVCAAAAHPASLVGKLLGIRPMRWLGERSYGIYLWHYPVIVLSAPPADQPVTIGHQIFAVLLSVVLAAASWRLVEQPIRRNGFISALTAWHRRPSSEEGARRALVATGTTLCGVALGFAVVSGASFGSLRTPHSPSVHKPAQVPRPRRHGQRSRNIRPTTTATETSTTAPTEATGTTRLATACRSVVHIGDSTSESLVSSNYLPNPTQRLGAQYQDVGVRRVIFEIEGGTSIVETLPGEKNGYELARQLLASGYRGCWVIALGTNDAADVYVGSHVGMASRIAEMMSVIGREPTMWVMAVSLLSSGPYSEQNMKEWNAALLRACRRYPNMAVFDWPAVAKPDWFISDGIHYSSIGSAYRAKAIAQALAQAFPLNLHGRRSACLIR